MPSNSLKKVFFLASIVVLSEKLSLILLLLSRQPRKKSELSVVWDLHIENCPLGVGSLLG